MSTRSQRQQVSSCRWVEVGGGKSGEATLCGRNSSPWVWYIINTLKPAAAPSLCGALRWAEWHVSQKISHRYWLFFVSGAQKRKKRRKKNPSSGTGKYFSFVFQLLTEALKIVVSAAGAWRLLDGTVGCGTMEGSVTGSAHLTGRMIKGLRSGPAFLLTTNMCFSLHWISAPCNHLFRS